MTLKHELFLSIGGNGELDSQELTKELELLADEKLQDFHDFLSRASVGLEDDIDWWVSGFSSRNCFTSPLFLNLLAVSLVVRSTDAGKPFSISTDSFFLFLLYKNFYKNRGVPSGKVRWTPEYKKILQNQVKFFVFIVLSPLFLIFTLISGRSYLRKPVLQEEIDLFSCFATPEWWANDTDRYFPNLTSHCSADRLKSVYFLPRTVGNKNWWRLRTENQKYRDGDKNVLILEDYITLKDCLYSWAHWIRVFTIKPKILSWDGISVGWLYYKEFISPSSLLVSIKAILYYRFLKNLRNSHVNIRSFTNFFENQAFDKALHKGIRDFFPAAKNVGYEGYSPVTSYYCSFPVQNEYDSGVLPDIIALPGKGFQSYVDQFVDGLETIVVPHLRGSSLYEYVGKDIVTKGMKVLIALPHTAADWWFFVDLASQIKLNYGDGVEIRIKPHPIVKTSHLHHLMDRRDLLEQVEIVGGDITRLIAQSSLLISSASGVLIESISLGVPVAIMRIPKKFMYNPIPPSVPRSLWIECDDADMLICYMESLLEESDEKYSDRARLSSYILDLFYEPISRRALDRILPSQLPHIN